MASAVNVSNPEVNTSSQVLLVGCEKARSYGRTSTGGSFVPVSVWRWAAPPSRIFSSPQILAETTAITAEARRHPTLQVQHRTTDIHWLTTGQSICSSSKSFPATYRPVDRSETSRAHRSYVGQASSNKLLERTPPRCALRRRSAAR